LDGDFGKLGEPASQRARVEGRLERVKRLMCKKITHRIQILRLKLLEKY